MSLDEYQLVPYAKQINLAAARLARKAVDDFLKQGRHRARASWPARWVRPPATASLSPDVEDPGKRLVTFDQLVAAYSEQARALIEGGVDLLMAETSTDTLNMKAALFAFTELFESGVRRVPVICSNTVVDKSGRTLSGQTLEAFVNSVSHVDLFALSLNCALGADEMRPYVEELSELSPLFHRVLPQRWPAQRDGANTTTRPSTWLRSWNNLLARAGSTWWGGAAELVPSTLLPSPKRSRACRHASRRRAKATCGFLASSR